MRVRSLLGLMLFGLLAACSESSTPSSSKSGVDASALAGQLLILDDAAGHWLSKEQFVLYNQKANKHISYQLVVAKSSDAGLLAQQQFTLLENSLSDDHKQHFPHLSNALALTFAKPLSSATIKGLLKSPLFIAEVENDKHIVAAHRVQIGNVLDDVYTSAENDADDVDFLGSRFKEGAIEFALWAPTARHVDVLLFNEDKSAYKTAQLALQENPTTGVWTASLNQANAPLYYQYAIEIYHPESQQVEQLITTDPYSLSLSVNSQYTQVIDLKSKQTQPKGWLTQQRPTVEHVEDNIFYELHIGDFSQYDQSLSNENRRGRYLAFTQTDSVSINHLKELQQAGLNNIHLLPTFDIGTLDEDVEKRISLTDSVEKLCGLQPENILCGPTHDQAIDKNQSILEVLSAYDPSGSDAQQVIEKLRLVDDYNWGYDPYHYTVPEGGFAVNPEGYHRIKEFRQMVQSLHNMGFRVIMDVVYNHTHQAGLSSKSVLDKIVPEYYQRLNPLTGAIERSTCCDNTATERVMMAKLMIDSLVIWADDYGIDGFRFDLMAHQPKDVMLAARKAVQAVDPDSYFYGEGWNFGEVANNQRFVQASQLELSGTEIGTFTDRLRDAVRGGGMTASGDEIRKEQGIGNGLYTVPNELRSQADSKAQYLLNADQLRVGLAGNLSGFPLQNAAGEHVRGKDIPYGNQPTGYALDPADTINYVSKHDNQTLWDNNQYRNAFTLTTEDRVRMHTLSLSYPMLAQGIPFIHMGSELIRSKSFVRDSYDFSHWFNKVDFAKQSNNYNVGLPAATTDKQNWDIVRKVLSKNEGRDLVKPEHIEASHQRFLELIEIRMSSPLFRLTTGKAINDNVRFLNTGMDQQLGLIAMQINDGDDIDPNYQQIIVLFNSGAQAQTFAFNDAGKFKLHPVQARCNDALICSSKAIDNEFTVSKFSAAVFVLPQ